jgi:membrane protease YdiL (CAAX protease family)
MKPNPLVMLLDGRVPAIAFFLKLVVIPTAILSVVSWIAYRRKDPRLATVIMLAAAANNALVAARKVKKTVAKEGG